MKLSTLAILLGVGFSLPQVYGLLKPAAARAFARGFPRSILWGYLLMLGGTAWFLWNLNQENISDFASYKPFMYVGFSALGLGACVYVKDFLAVRGLAIVMLLLAQLVLEKQRWADTGWKNVLAVWAYVWVVAGLWWTVSPWRLRDWIEWNTASDSRLKAACLARLVFGLVVIGLGLAVY